MADKNLVMIDGNAAAGHVAHALSEVIAIYPITPSSPMGELADEYSAKGQKNIWGTIPKVVELQSEAGAAGAVHGALTTGALSTTFTASQGLLLMIPNMYKIAGEATSTVFHVAARAVASSALSIFGDHQDVMACKQIGWALLASNSVQEAMDLAVIAHAATLEARVPFLHFFDGFRTSHEVQKIEEVSYEVMREMVNDDLVRAHRERGLSPERPTIRGTAQNPDVYFQGIEARNKFYLATPEIVQRTMDKFAQLVGRQYHLYDYVGSPDAESVIIIMGSGSEVVEETVEELNKKGGKYGAVKVHLYRPFDAKTFVSVLPKTVKKIAVLDRTKEAGSLGEPLYLDVCTAIRQMQAAGTCPFTDTPLIIGGRYGLGSKEFTPAMTKAVFDNLNGKAIHSFTVGIEDDVTNASIPVDENFELETSDMHQALFYGLGSDGTVGANKSSIKIIGEATDNKVQAYFSYDSKKSGGITISHLRFGKNQIRKPYLITHADFVACHKFTYVEKYDMIRPLKKGGIFLLNAPYSKDEVWNHLPTELQKQIIDKQARCYVIDAMNIAAKAGMGTRINIVMQTAFFKISEILPEAEAIDLIKKFVKKTYGKKGEYVVNKNIATVDMSIAGVHEVSYPKEVTSAFSRHAAITDDAPDFVKNVLGKMALNEGDRIKVSEMPIDGTFPTATTQYEKRAIGEIIPIWKSELCIQCGQCSFVCPHAAIRMKAYDAKELTGAPSTFKSCDYKGKEFEGAKFTVQVSADDCTGCGLCVEQCPAKSKENPQIKAINMEDFATHRAAEVANWKHFFKIANPDVTKLNLNMPKGIAMKQPLFEFSGACPGCGETPYIRTISQLFGDRLVVANATGCSSIYGGNLPTTPYAKRNDGRGPAWANSLFEDNAEFAYGMRLTSDKLREYAYEVATAAKQKGIAVSTIEKLLNNPQADDMQIEEARTCVEALAKELANSSDPIAKELLSLKDHFVRRSVWAFGGDGWAYDIGYGGLDHVLASGKNINILVMDTEVYSNTGGQMSKATPIGAVAKFAAGGRDTPKKDIGMMAISYGYIYVAQIAMGANMSHTIKALREAESYDGPSLIIAYSHCINHGINMVKGMQIQKDAVECGLWPLYRFDPRLVEQGKNPFQLDSKEPNYNLADFMYNQVRFKSLKTASPDRANALLAQAEKVARRKWQEYKYLADRPF
ncbi:MAG: pyruvate:ferredoxin (flavodoxin) oxidoreductase [Spirochaetaceae bacterium]|nr:pyruvate:ferredoxin (flavodoxin) oxidoreductase [Spirochaetaceae bacterium]